MSDRELDGRTGIETEDRLIREERDGASTIGSGADEVSRCEEVSRIGGCPGASSIFHHLHRTRYLAKSTDTREWGDAVATDGLACCVDPSPYIVDGLGTTVAILEVASGWL